MDEEKSNYPTNVIKTELEKLKDDDNDLRLLILRMAANSETTRLELCEKMVEIADAIKQLAYFSREMGEIKKEATLRRDAQLVFDRQGRDREIAIREIREKVLEIIALKKTIHIQLLVIGFNSIILLAISIFVLFHVFSVTQ